MYIMGVPVQVSALVAPTPLSPQVFAHESVHGVFFVTPLAQAISVPPPPLVPPAAVPPLLVPPPPLVPPAAVPPLLVPPALVPPAAVPPVPPLDVPAAEDPPVAVDPDVPVPPVDVALPVPPVDVALPVPPVDVALPVPPDVALPLPPLPLSELLQPCCVATANANASTVPDTITNRFMRKLLCPAFEGSGQNAGVPLDRTEMRGARGSITGFVQQTHIGAILGSNRHSKLLVRM